MNAPSRWRVGPFRASAFTSPLHDERVAAILGVALGIAFTTCFLTGVLSHMIQHPPGWFGWPSRPAGLYRVTQGLHVATGIASVPLLLAKLWTVFPHFWTWPPMRDVAHAVERASLLPLVGGSLFLLFSGVGNIDRWRPWHFSFTVGHFWAAWITIGALIVHIGAKATITRRALFRTEPTEPRSPGDMSRRGFLATIGAGVGVLTFTTIGQTLPGLRRFAVLAPRRPNVGPQGVPVNATAVGARVVDAATDPAWRLTVAHGTRALSFSRDELRALPQHEVELPISCVEGWSASARWRGVRVRDLLEMIGAPPDASARVESLQERSIYRTSELNNDHAHDADTLLALEINGETLALDHGYPVRLIGPNRPGVMQTKWLSKLEVV